MGVYDGVLKELLEEANQNQIEAAKQLLNDANSLVPVKTGELKASGHIEVNKDSVAVVYDAEHALTVHESPESSGYKWLERTADMNIDKYIKTIAGG